MTEPRRVLAGKTYLLTRRCAGRRFYLRPDKLTNAAVTYCLARAVRRTGVAIHAISVMSNHLHIVLTDVEGRLPEFAMSFFRELACCLKTNRRIAENVWSTRKYSAVELLTREAVIDSIAYVIANPVTAGLVRKARLWPGVITRPASPALGTTFRARRPAWFRARRAENEELAFSPPPVLAAESTSGWVASVEEAVRERELEAARDLRARAQRPMGEDAVCRTDPFAAPAMEPRGEAISTVPVFGARSGQTLRAAVGALREWRSAYRASFAAWRSGSREAEFPAGTWWMSRVCGARAAPLMAA